jgi:hypothetical protein
MAVFKTAAQNARYMRDIFDKEERQQAIVLIYL